MRRLSPCLPLLLAIACGDSTNTSASASGSTSTTDPTTPPTSSTTLVPTTGASITGDTTAGSATDSMGATTTTGATGPTTTTGDLSATMATTTTSTGPDQTTTTSSTSTGDTGDTSTSTTDDSATGNPCDGGGMVEFSYIWIANSTQGTVSKINTFTGIEEGRYYTSAIGEQPDPNTGPSRTSVNLYGDVAVANRNGGVTKFAARKVDCIDKNNDGNITTSTGPNDIKPWLQDECQLWFHDTPPREFNEGPRPIAWEAGLNEMTCEVDPNPRLWFGFYDFAANNATIRRLDGDTGMLLDEVQIPNWSGENWGTYGGAVNKDGDFWVTGWGANGPAVRVDADTLMVEYIANPDSFDGSFYGMALDAKGDPWVGDCGNSSVYHYDVAAMKWEIVAVGPGCLRGLQVDKEGRAFIAHNGFPAGMMVVDTFTETVIKNNVMIPGAQTPVGVSIDVEGFVWVVDQSCECAFKIDPDTYQVVLQVNGLQQPYTYSDMTGAGLKLVTFPQ